MDLDKPLDDMITSKKREQRPRQSRDRREQQAPYARPPPRSTEDKWVHDAYQGGGGGRRGPAAGRQAAESGANHGVPFTGVSPRIEVIGLHYEVTPQDLKSIFSQAGTLVQGPTIRYDFSGRSKGEATMEFASYQQAKIAINKFDGAMTKGQTISIRLLPPAVQRAPAGGKAQGASSGNLLSRISGGDKPASGPRPAGGARGDRGGRGGRGAPRGRGAPGAARGGRKAPASAGDLDSELDSFMKNDSKAAGDVDMA